MTENITFPQTTYAGGKDNRETSHREYKSLRIAFSNGAIKNGKICEIQRQSETCFGI